MNAQPLLGRDDVVARAETLLADCRAGRGRVLWVHGDAGIGKTRVLLEVAARAEGCTVLRGTGWEDPGTPSFWVWSQVLRAAAAVHPPEQWGDRARPALPLLEGTGEAQSEVPGRFPLFDAVAGVVDDLAREQPVVLLLDDVHWVDEGSLRLLQHLTSDLAQRAVLVVCGWRDHETDVTAEQRDLAARIASRGESWLLRGLPSDDVRALITATTGRDPGEDETRAVAERTGGNPLFVSEMARLAASRGVGSVATVLPESAKATIRRRVARLAQPAEAALGAAAVLGASSSVTRLASLLGTPPAELAAMVDDLVDAGLVTHEGDRLDFSHALIRDAVHETLAPARRRELHLAAAELVDAGYARTGALAAERAHHLIQALPLVSTDTAAAAAQDASRAATAMLAYEDAAGWCDRVLELVDVGSPRRADLLLLAGETRLSTGELDRAREAFLAAAELARRADDADLFARAALGFASGLSGFEVFLFDRAQTDLLEEALVRLGREDSVRRAQVLARLSVALSFSATTERRRTLAEEAVAMARGLDDPAALAGALAAHCDAVAGPAYVDLRKQQAGEIIDLARLVPDVALELLGLRLRVVARLERGDLGGARQDIGEFERLVARLRQPFFSWYTVLWRGLEAHLAGDLVEMGSCATEIGRLAELGGSRNALVLSHVQSAWPQIERGLAAAAMEHMLTVFGDLPELAGDGGSVVRLFHGQPAEVRSAALPLVPQILANLPVDKEWLPNLSAVVGGFWEQDIGGEPARLVHDELAPWAELFLVDGIGAAFLGSVELALGQLTTLLGDYDAAAGHFERALDRNAMAGAALPVANTQRAFAEMLRRRRAPGDEERRRALLTESLAFYRGAGILERVAEVEELLGPAPTAEVTEVTEAIGTFRRAGSFWMVGWRGREATLPAVKGMADLAVLLAQPDRETHVLDLVGATGAPRSDLGEVIDAPAREAYRARLAELEERLTEAEATGDADASEQATTEREFLLAELGAAYGLGGRARRAGDPAERARTTVTSRVRDAIRRIDDALPELGRHLRASVRTGTYCIYAPESPTTWDTRPTS
ncbi:AAA family ATPase [Marmoricola sp. URHB0036]|uniref:ATP-binding protein n=1 Tax=Marmoricola sp. URHB0036 TaxID=1298863 RepID=UPI00040A9154|nr:AAA family ATPase [Marmoricola sp. URHB0036]